MAKKAPPPLSGLRANACPIEVLRTDYNPKSPPARNSCWEIVFVTAGTGKHHVAGTSHFLQAGDVFVLGKNDRHSYSDTHGLGLIHVRFDYAALAMDEWETRSVPGFQALFRIASPKGPSAPWPRLHLESIHLGQSVALTDEIEKCMLEQLPCWRTLVRGHFCHLVILLSRVYDTTLRPHNDAPQRVAKAVIFFRDNFRQPVDLDRLIERIGMSRRSFFRLFKRATGEAPLNYLIQLRLRHACTLLRNTDQSITQIGFDSGFSDSNYFTREFRKVIGETPRSYRKRWAD